MADKTKKTATGYEYIPMPETMYFDLKERGEREKIARLEDGFIKTVDKIRSKGVIIEKMKDLQGFTPDYVHKQIENTKRARLQNTQFLPEAIRKSEEMEFKKMEDELIPLAESIQSLLPQIPFKIHLGANGQDTYFDGGDVDAYIKNACTEKIPEDVREYYDKLQTLCESWNSLCNWAEEKGFSNPSMRLIRTLTNEEKYTGVPSEISGQDPCKMGLTPELMFRIYTYGIIKKK